MIETWTRITVEGEDFFDVLETYDEICGLIKETTTYISVTSVTGYRITIRRLSVQAFYESSVEILRNNWVRCKELDDLKKSVVGWEET